MQAVSLGRRGGWAELLVGVGEPSVSIQVWGGDQGKRRGVEKWGWG